MTYVPTSLAEHISATQKLPNMTKLATMTWGPGSDQTLVEAERSAYIKAQITLGNTDALIGDLHPTNPDIGTRRWLDQPSAEAWQTFIVNLAAQHGLTVSVEITDLV